MELLLMAIVLHASSLFEGLEGAAISSSENVSMSYTTDEYMEETSGPHSPSLSQSCSGTLQTRYHDNWVAVTLKSQSTQENENMDKICKYLGCGGIIDFQENETAPFNTCLSDCIIMNSTLHNCTAAASNCSKVTEVNCERHAVRLSGGVDKCGGRVELLDAGLWGSVCDDEWDVRGGEVVCSQLGCGTAIMITKEARHFGPGIGPIHLSKINCTGTEKNLWECSTVKIEDNYCGHKEDAGVVCSESAGLTVTTVKTIKPDLTNWTTEYVTEIATGDSNTELSAPVVGCIVLSITLLLVLFSIAAHCVYYKRRNAGGPGTRRSLQADESETSSESDYTSQHYTSQPAIVNRVHNYTSVIGVGINTQESFTRERNAQQNTSNVDHDSDSTSSWESYDNTQTEREKLFNLAVEQLSPEHSVELQMSSLHNTNQPAKSNYDDHDSDSTSSGECYENSQKDREKLFNQEHSAELQMSPLHNSNHLAESNNDDHDSDSTSSGECYENTQKDREKLFSPEHSTELQMSPLHNSNHPAKSNNDDHDSDSTSSGECYENTQKDSEKLFNPELQMPPLSNTSQPDWDPADSDSTSSGECYENIGTNAEADMQTLEGNPSLPEQPPVSHTTSLSEGNNSLPQPVSSDQDHISTSSEEMYENVPESDNVNSFTACEPDQTSSDSDYDDVSNW